jgi:hypothetical protein
MNESDANRVQDTEETSGVRDSPTHVRSGADFPSTNHGWIGTQLALGEVGRAAVVQHVMSSYAVPLERYLRGSSYRAAGEAKELVQGFLADRVTQTDFFARWMDSGMKLRRWLMNGFLFYLRETVRRNQRAPQTLESDPSDDREAAHRQFEREWGLALVARALERARSSCERRGQRVHWEMLERHYLHGVPYATLIEEYGVTAKEAATMVRTAAGKLRRAFFDLLDRDGVPESEIDGEIARLMEALRP